MLIDFPGVIDGRDPSWRPAPRPGRPLRRAVVPRRSRYLAPRETKRGQRDVLLVCVCHSVVRVKGFIPGGYQARPDADGALWEECV